MIRDNSSSSSSGSIEIFKTLHKNGEKTREAVLGVLGEGALFGEMALIEDEKLSLIHI